MTAKSVVKHLFPVPLIGNHIINILLASFFSVGSSIFFSIDLR